MKVVLKYLLVSMVVFYLLPFSAYATDSNYGKTITVNNICTAPDDILEDIGLPELPDQYKIIRPNRIAGNIVRCVGFIVNLAGYQLIFNFVLDFASIVFYTLIIAIIFFSIRVMFGTARLQGITFLFIAKILFVLYVSNPLNIIHLIEWRDALIEFPKDISYEILEHVESPITKDKGFLSDPGDVIFGTDDVFDYFDKLFMHMIGVQDNLIKTHQTEEVFIGLAALISGFIFTGPIGAALVLVMLIYVTSIMFAMAQAVIFFCTVIVAINFLIAIAPIAALCLLFNPTRRITQLWFNYLLVYTIQPILLMAFLGLILGMMARIVNMPDLANPENIIPGHMEHIYFATQAKWNNYSGDDIQELTVLKCGELNNAAASLAGLMGKASSAGNIWGSIYSQSRANSSGLDNYLSTGRFTDYANVKFGNDNDDCSIKVHGLKLDHNNPFIAGVTNTTDPNIWKTYMSEDMLQKFTGQQLAIIVIMILLVSFLTNITKNIDRMVGTGVIPNIVQYATNPVNKAQQSVFGGGGYLMQGRQAVLTSVANRGK